jgi:hypothetical protein
MTSSNGSWQRRRETPASSSSANSGRPLLSLSEFPGQNALTPKSAEFPFEVDQLIYGLSHWARTATAWEENERKIRGAARDA